MVDAGARVQAELLVEQSGLQSLRQIYGDGNVRVRETQARIASLQRELTQMTGSSAPLVSDDVQDDAVPGAAAIKANSIHRYGSSRASQFLMQISIAA